MQPPHHHNPNPIPNRIKLKAFKPFENTAEAVAAATDVIESSLGKDLKKFLKKSLKDQDLQDKLAVADTKLGAVIKEKLGLDIATGDVVGELFRGIRTQLDALLTGMSEANLKAMQLGLSHSLSRYKLKFSADKVDTMIVQAIGLLDELDKEINTYAMRVREWCVRFCGWLGSVECVWMELKERTLTQTPRAQLNPSPPQPTTKNNRYGWHFPELVKVVNDNVQYAKLVVRVGMRTNAKGHDLSDILGDDAVESAVRVWVYVMGFGIDGGGPSDTHPNHKLTTPAPAHNHQPPEKIKQVKESAEVSMGQEISENDLASIRSLAQEVVDLSAYRISLFDYLKNRMAAIAPNLTIMVRARARAVWVAWVAWIGVWGRESVSSSMHLTSPEL